MTETFLRGFVSWESNECVEWPYGTNDKGYGLATIDGKQMGAQERVWPKGQKMQSRPFNETLTCRFDGTFTMRK